MSDNIEKSYIEWEHLDRIVNLLCIKIKETFPSGEITSVTGIARGGLIPAVMVSHKLGLPYTESIKAGTLVVDDICDSGVTLKNHQASYKAALYYKPHTSCFKPDVYGIKVLHDRWLVFPFEEKDSKTIQGYLDVD